MRVLLDEGIPILGTRETMTAAWRLYEARGGGTVPDNGLLEVVPGATYLLGDVEVMPFRVSHDVPTCGYRFSTGEGGARRTVVVATDLGCAPDALLPIFDGADAVLIEANYNDDLLRKSRRHPVHKGRVASDRGHLSNVQCGDFLSRLVQAGGLPRSVVLCHLSEDHNDPGLARTEVGLASRLEGRLDLQTAPRFEAGPEIAL
jgi:phosphoribosyl 1,2-cyclic phosphodiesterase